MSGLTAVSSVKVPRLENARSPFAPRSKINDFSTDLIAHAFQFLSASEVVGARGVSKTFSSAFKKWTKATEVLELDALFTAARLRAFITANSFPRVTNLRREPISGDEYGSSKDEKEKELVLAMAEKCPKVNKLSLSSDPQGMLTTYLVAFGKNLRVLNLDSIYAFSLDGERIRSCPKLEELRVTGDSFSSADSIQESLIPELMELEVIFGDPGAEQTEEDVWDAVSGIASHCKKADSKLAKLILTIQGDESYINGSIVKELLSCEKLKDLRVRLK